ncbi:hypothetical protein FA95DRAFT_1553248 [Auriscalpium vulgare]|uniref:Uncharacterized protein n=1 Tax=Auriscalpium vulgare TaxID=40419 RepID=A0ACB8S7J5_9AGAM|nr:hypothetical protein FA95DRAFT_1553248 [Auriscalpium vulgare]
MSIHAYLSPSNTRPVPDLAAIRSTRLREMGFDQRLVRTPLRMLQRVRLHLRPASKEDSKANESRNNAKGYTVCSQLSSVSFAIFGQSCAAVPIRYTQQHFDLAVREIEMCACCFNMRYGSKVTFQRHGSDRLRSTRNRRPSDTTHAESEKELSEDTIGGRTSSLCTQ